MLRTSLFRIQIVSQTFKFLKFYFKDREIDGDKGFFPYTGLLSQKLPTARAEAQSWEFNPGLSFEPQGPDYVSRNCCLP